MSSVVWGTIVQGVPNTTIGDPRVSAGVVMSDPDLEVVRIGLFTSLSRDFDLLKNGATAQSFVSAGGSANEVIELATPLVSADELELRQTTVASMTSIRALLEIATSTPAAVYGYASAIGVVGHAVRAWGRIDLASSVALNELTENTMNKAGNLVRAAIHTDAGDATTDFGIYKNGALSETLTNIGAGSVVVAITSTAVAKGDQVAIQQDGGTAAGRTNVQIEADFEGYIIAWGGDAGATGEFYHAHGRADLGGLPSGAPGNQSEHEVTADINYESLSGNTAAADATTDFKIHRNGAADVTVPFTAATDVVTVSGFATKGDTLALEYDAGTDPNDSTYVLNCKRVM